jgi:HEAT repeat protein
MDSHNDVIRAGAAIALGSVRSVVAKRKLIALTGYGHSVKVRRAALESLADNWKPDDDVRLRLEQLTSDGMQDVRHKAIETLGTIANPRSRGVLHEVINKSLDIILRREARRAIVLRGQPAGS